MQPTKWKLRRAAWWAIGIALLAAAFVQRAFQNLARIDFHNSNFAFFWLAGRMIDLGLNPYNSDQWLTQHPINQVAWQSDRIFSYPLPLAVFFAPLGLWRLEAAYVGWQLISLSVVAASVWLILRSIGTPQPARLFFPIALGLLFFGPAYLSVQIGALSALSLAVLTAGILALEARRDLGAGVLLSLLLLKPSQGLPILLLGGIWLLLLRRWRSIAGMALGLTGIVLLGLALEPSWLRLFATSSQGLMTRNQGLHSNVFSVAWDLVGSRPFWPWILGGLAALILNVLALRFLWRRRHDLTQLAAFSLIIPIGFVTALYGWSYDQILYVIPVTWVAGQLARSPRGYIAAFGFSLVVVATSLVALAVHAYTGTDVLSSSTTLLVLVGVGAVINGPPPKAQ